MDDIIMESSELVTLSLALEVSLTTRIISAVWGETSCDVSVAPGHRLLATVMPPSLLNVTVYRLLLILLLI